MGFVSWVGDALGITQAGQGIANTFGAISGVFGNLFSFITLNILAPLIAVIGALVFFYLQYKLLQVYIWIVKHAYLGAKGLFGLLDSKYGKKLTEFIKS